MNEFKTLQKGSGRAGGIGEIKNSIDAYSSVQGIEKRGDSVMNESSLLNKR